MFDRAEIAVQAAMDAGAKYADGRAVLDRVEEIEVQDQRLRTLSNHEKVGVGVRALIGSSWGFASTGDLSDASLRACGERAASVAKASALVSGPPLEFPDVVVSVATWETPHVENPLDVPVSAVRRPDHALPLLAYSQDVRDAEYGPL